MSSIGSGAGVDGGVVIIEHADTASAVHPTRLVSIRRQSQRAFMSWSASPKGTWGGRGGRSTLRRLALAFAVLFSGAACSMAGETERQPYVPEDYGLRQAAVAHDVYYLRSAPAPATPEEVPQEHEDDDLGIYVHVGGGGKTVSTHQRWDQQYLCQPGRSPNYVPAGQRSDSERWHHARVRCLQSEAGRLTEDTKFDKDGSVVAQYYWMSTRRGDRVVEVELGALPNRATAWWMAGLADADLARWEPSDSELRRLDDLVRSTG